MKNRHPKVGSTSYYIEEVVDYCTQYRSGDNAKNGYPPIVAELLLSLLIEVRTFCTVGRVALGALCLLILKLLIVGS